MPGKEPKERGLRCSLRQAGSLPPGLSAWPSSPATRALPAGDSGGALPPGGPSRPAAGAAGSGDHGHSIQPGPGARKFPHQTGPAPVPSGRAGPTALEPELLELGQLWGRTL